LKEAKYARMLDRDETPSERSALGVIGTRGSKLWKQLRAFLKVNYDFKPELIFGGQKYGWCYKYRRKNKTLCVLFPETKAFTVLVVMGKKEVAQFEGDFSKYNEDTQHLFKTAPQYHDGKWLYKRVLNKSDLLDALALIRLKAGRKG
jgi:hypothetical protein